MRRIVLFLLAAGCAIFQEGDKVADGGPEPMDDGDDWADGGDGTGATESDADADSDADTDSDADSDADTDADTGEPAFDCTAEPSTPSMIDECVTAELSCGDSIVSTTRGGTHLFNDANYVSWFCESLPKGEYASAERIYSFIHPGDRDVTIDLQAPCEEADVFAIQWRYWDEDGVCPTDGTIIGICEADDSRADGSILLPEDPQNRAYSYLIVVDSPDPHIDGSEEVGTPFALSIDCN